MVLRLRHDDAVPTRLPGPAILRRRWLCPPNHSSAQETDPEPGNLRRQPPEIVVPEKPLVREMHSGPLHGRLLAPVA